MKISINLLIFLAQCLLFSPGAGAAIVNDLARPLQMISDTGAVIKDMTVNLGERFSGDEFNFRLDLPYKFRNYSERSSITFEVGECTIVGRDLRHISAKISGDRVVSISQITNGFAIEIQVSTDEESEGALVCRGSELRNLETGGVLASAQIIGFFRKKPRWTTRFGHCGREIEFSFDQKISTHNPHSPVDSHPVEIRLIHARSYPADTLYAAPKKCRIGKQHFDGNYLALVINRREILDGGVWSVACPCFHAASMRILARANMGDKYGSVVCEISGALTYTY